ncbi:hypothetical protein VTH06DRAFT_3740 [Thermothelomyces fergusii]
MLRFTPAARDLYHCDLSGRGMAMYERKVASRGAKHGSTAAKPWSLDAQFTTGRGDGERAPSARPPGPREAHPWDAEGTGRLEE